MRSNFNKTAAIHFADLLPTRKIVASEVSIVVLNLIARTKICPGPYHCEDGVITICLEKWEDLRIRALQAIIKAEHDRVFRQFRFSISSIDKLLQTDDVITMRMQPVKLRSKISGADCILIWIKARVL